MSRTIRRTPKTRLYLDEFDIPAGQLRNVPAVNDAREALADAIGEWLMADSLAALDAFVALSRDGDPVTRARKATGRAIDAAHSAGDRQ